MAALKKCTHEQWERESSIYTEGFCPWCLVEEIERLQGLLQAARKDLERERLGARDTERS